MAPAPLEVVTTWPTIPLQNGVKAAKTAHKTCILTGYLMADLVPLEQRLPPERNPAAVYLAGSVPTGRAAMLCKLDRAARLLGFDNAQ